MLVQRAMARSRASVLPGRAWSARSAKCWNSGSDRERRLPPAPSSRSCLICPPLDLSPYVGRQLNQPVVRQATDHLMRVLQSHSQQEYVDAYARRAS
ncbi:MULTISPECIES: hypothetical protein [unclassified Kribbella]|uniref:hypothetical protein n=1 Tax=unclassified Kribbella TaxID=2644121 RepID=UPI00301AD8A6